MLIESLKYISKSIYEVQYIKENIDHVNIYMSYESQPWEMLITYLTGICTEEAEQLYKSAWKHLNCQNTILCVWWLYLAELIGKSKPRILFSHVSGMRGSEPLLFEINKKKNSHGSKYLYVYNNELCPSHTHPLFVCFLF